VSGVTNRQVIADKFNADGTRRAAVEMGHYIVLCIEACKAVGMQRPREGRIYQGRFSATARQTCSRGSESRRNDRRAVFSPWSVLRCYEQGTRLELSQFCTGVCEEKT
jgi:hypothetical protein